MNKVIPVYGVPVVDEPGQSTGDSLDRVVGLHEGTCTSSTPTLDPWRMKQLLQEPLSAEERTGLTGVYVYAAPPLDQAAPAPYVPPATDQILLNYTQHQPDALLTSLVQDLLVRVQKLEQQLADLLAKRPAKAKPAHKAPVKKGKK
jgi:hypothetical protein